MPEPMTNEEYARTQSTLVLIARLADGLDLEGFARRVDVAHAEGPILDPTLYRRGMGRLQGVGKLASATKKVQEVWAELREVVEREEARQ
jgi:hypothetical protein